jgi:hypothetical protein
MPGLVDWSFILTLVVILFATLVGSYLRSSRKDRCLQDFDSFHITVERKNNRVIWGIMKLFPTGFDLTYRADVQDERHIETSYIFYKDEYRDIQAVYRHARELDDGAQKRRARDVQRALHPSLQRRFRRSFRNFLSTASDSLNEALGMIVGRARKPAAKLMTDTSETYIKNIGKDIIGYVGTSYDPLLESYIGTRVVLELVEDDEVHEHVGVLKEYSAEFLEVLDVYFPLPKSVKLAGDAQRQLDDKVVLTLDGRQLRVRNTAQHPLYVESLRVGDQLKDVSAIVGGDEEIVLHLGDDGSEVVINLRVASRLDMIVPRSHALIRHRAERYDPDTIFDVGLSLVRRQSDQREMERLRKVLSYSPWDVISAAKLGEMLMRDGEFVEAEKWLLHARESCHHLPDRGARVAHNLRQLDNHRDEIALQQAMSLEMRLDRPEPRIDASPTDPFAAGI